MKRDKVLTGIIIASIIGFLITLTIIITPIINFRKNQSERLIRVPIVVVTINSNEMIMANFIDYKIVKEIKVPDNLIYDSNDIIGRCVKEGITIQADSYIRRNQLTECENITR